MANQVIGIGENGYSALFQAGKKQAGRKEKTGTDQIQVKAPKQTRLQQYKAQGVDLELSEEFSKFTEEELEEMKKSEEMQSLAQMYQEQLESAKKAAEAAGEGFEDMGKALEIARRLMHGDIVPSSDEKFLMDYNKDVYMAAKNMQMMAQNEKSKKYDSILEDEEEEGEEGSASVRQEGGDLVIDASGLNLGTGSFDPSSLK